jgi:hypothetical protein
MTGGTRRYQPRRPPSDDEKADNELFDAAGCSSLVAFCEVLDASGEALVGLFLLPSRAGTAEEADNVALS